MYRKVLFTGNYATACLNRSLLAGAGFHPAPVPEAVPADRGYYLEVPENEVDEAVALLAEQGYEADLISRRQWPVN
jgi:hypothetical protein